MCPGTVGYRRDTSGRSLPPSSSILSVSPLQSLRDFSDLPPTDQTWQYRLEALYQLRRPQIIAREMGLFKTIAQTFPRGEILTQPGSPSSTNTARRAKKTLPNIVAFSILLPTPASLSSSPPTSTRRWSKPRTRCSNCSKAATALPPITRSMTLLRRQRPRRSDGNGGGKKWSVPAGPGYGGGRGQGGCDSWWPNSADHHPQVLSSSDHARASFLYQYHGIQVLKIQWLHEPSSKPPTLYLASCTISLPLIGLVQIAHYITLGSAQGLSPNQLSSQLSAGVTGHSQGIVVAALIAVQLPSKKDTWSEFSQSGLHAITTLFHIGFHGSVAFPQTSLPPKLVEITAENEGVSTPMLATIYSWSRRMPRCPFLTAQSFCSHVSSSHVGRFGICIAKSKAETGRDQSRILLGCSVFNTETGDDMRTEKKGYLESLADEIFTRPIKWTQACVFPEDTTHIINFGLDA
ncbi:hypothetical protein PCANC_00138 [Puccinia coronata f. sp. avenae]|uniref:Starter acyltransferase (SAT) domain-containing protein n=1 Tax=Puccinia coronata f. sp. avenae TaxID=200324 RepID=A0A2N5W8U2_9BASI|nr:hypothetical protein PCANC_00138 [Puccinia coronata f. sp. avenae]